MSKIPQKLIEILEQLGHHKRAATWDCHGTPVVLHKVLEQVAAAIRASPLIRRTMIEADAEKKTVVMLVSGRLGDAVEWSIGEAVPYNNKNSYPYAMAEKRAKDRVILKLIGVAGFVYSEEEADDFQEHGQQRDQRPAAASCRATEATAARWTIYPSTITLGGTGWTRRKDVLMQRKTSIRSWPGPETPASSV